LKLLLDTHTMFWWSIDQARLSSAAFSAIKSKDNEVYVSIASAWEIAIKVGLGKWPEAANLIDQFEAETAASGFVVLPVTLPHVREAGLMRSPHRDPFDRLLASQARIEGLSLVSADPKLSQLGAAIVW
jgi:PIN domain nuclease of toxin-antitoxin system